MAKETTEPRNEPTKTITSWITQVLDNSISQGLVYPRRHWQVLREITQRFRFKKWSSFIVGGLIRDLVMSRGLKAPRDIDIVVCDIDLGDLAHEFRTSFVRRRGLGA
jgi:hypothetical protein